MKRLTREKRTLILKCWTEGVGVNATARMADVSKNTVLKFLADLGPVCVGYHNQAVRGLKAERVQCDEVWSFCVMKEKNVPQDRKGEYGIGDCWTWTALDADSKLMISWLLGARDAGTAWEFMHDVAGRLDRRIQLTTDGHLVYLEAVEDAFGAGIDYAMLIKLYGTDPEASTGRYSPPQCIGARCERITGRPDPVHVSTSFVERMNLEIRTKNRRFTRLTNGFSKKIQNLEHSLSVGFFVYNFVRQHGTTRVSPAMAAGVEDHLWSYEDVIALLEAQEESAVEVAQRRKDRRKSD